VETPSGVKNVENSSGVALRVFPNPTRGEFRLAVPEAWFGQDFQLRVSDVLGKIWLSEALVNDQIILGESWPNGVYWVEVLDALGRKLGACRVVKIRG
jgi:hypothetical protein